MNTAQDVAACLVAIVLWVAGATCLLAAFGPKVKTATPVQMGAARLLLGIVSVALLVGAWALTVSVLGG